MFTLFAEPKQLKDCEAGLKMKSKEQKRDIRIGFIIKADRQRSLCRCIYSKMPKNREINSKKIPDTLAVSGINQNAVRLL